jgi:hypothetical protein
MRRQLLIFLLVTCPLALLGVAVIGGMAFMGILMFAGRQDPCPAKRHLAGVDTGELLRVARALGNDVDKRGVYWDPALEKKGSRVERPEKPRDMSELPAIIRDLAPLQASVGGGGVTLTWDDPGYGYGVSLLLRPDGADDAEMIRNNGSFHWYEKIQDGVWSFFQFH